jgi:PKD repeat protein
MRRSHALALVLGLTGLGTACGGVGNGPSNTPPAVAFTPSCVLLVCTFADGSTDADGQLTAYNWDFGDGTAAAITKDAVHTYGTANTYPVSLTVTDNDGAATSVTQSVLVRAPANVPPTAAFTSSCAGLACSFTGLGTDGDGTVVGFQWDLGDGAVAATQNATHAYTSAGTYAVGLTVTDDSGATGTLSQQLTVTAPQAVGPTANFADSCAVVGHYGRIVFVDCTFTDQSTAAAGATVTAWAWDFGDGRTSTEQNPPVHHYTISWRPGMRVAVRLTVTDNHGLTNGVTRSVPVNTPANAAPTASFTSSCTDLMCTFTDLSNDGDGTVVGFHWDFGDGAVAATQNSTHAYASAGTYVVVLTVTDDRGAPGTLSQPVTVTAPQTTAPTIALGVSPLLQNLCYPARAYSTRGCPSGGSVTISNIGGGTLRWTSTTSAPWLKRSPTSGTAPSTMRVWVDGTGLPPGSYSGDILISATGATNSPRGVFVHVTK